MSYSYYKIYAFENTECRARPLVYFYVIHLLSDGRYQEIHAFRNNTACDEIIYTDNLMRCFSEVVKETLKKENPPYFQLKEPPMRWLHEMYKNGIKYDQNFTR